MTVQLALDLFGDQARADQFIRDHQLGQVRLPYTTADGRQKGSLVPAWRCCACGGIELSRHWLETEHCCCGYVFLPYCQNPPGRSPSPYRMDAHWIPPA